MAQHPKTWYRDHRDSDRPASKAMEPLSDKLKGQSKDSQRNAVGYAIVPGWMDRNKTSIVGGEMMHDSLTAASRAIHGCRGEARNVTVTSGHGTKSKELVESMERSWVRQHKTVLKKNREILKNAAALDSSKGWSPDSRRAVDEFEPDDAAFPDLRSSLDRDDASAKELTRVFERNNVTNLEELVKERANQLWLTNKSDSDEVWAVEADIRRVQDLAIKRVRLGYSAIARNKWTEHVRYMSTALRLGSRMHTLRTKDSTSRT